jgi:hypothetical protein
MKIDMKNIYFFCIITAILFSCKKENNSGDEVKYNYSITGVAQKGPFAQGSKVTVYELNNKLEQTGKVFKTETSDDFGAFELKDMQLTSTFIQVEVEGNPYNEVNGGYIVGDDIAMSNIVNLKRGTVVNVNLLSDLARQRMKYLIQSGTGFDDAKIKAEREAMSVFGLDSFYVSGSEKMDITQSDDASGSLLALTAIFMTARGQQYKMFLQQYVAKVRSDLETDGILSDTSLSNLITLALITINSENIRTTLSNYYNKDIPSFQKYVDVAIRKLKISHYSSMNVTFPDVNGNILARPGDTLFVNRIEGLRALTIQFPSDGYKRIRLTVEIDTISDWNMGINTDWTLVSSNFSQRIYEANVIGKTEQIDIHCNAGKQVYVRVEDVSQTPFKTLVQKWFQYNF